MQCLQNHLRLVQAKKLLRDGESISNVALNTGFADQSHFSRHFKRLFGVTPGRIQRSTMRTEMPSTAVMTGPDGSPATIGNKTTITMTMELVEK